MGFETLRWTLPSCGTLDNKAVPMGFETIFACVLFATQWSIIKQSLWDLKRVISPMNICYP